MQTNPERKDRTQDDIPHENVVDTMLDDIMEAMEHKNGDICSNYDYSCVEEHAMDDKTYSLSDALENKLYI